MIQPENQENALEYDRSEKRRFPEAIMFGFKIGVR
jgi:hypothetical protein